MFVEFCHTWGFAEKAYFHENEDQIKTMGIYENLSKNTIKATVLDGLGFYCIRGSLFLSQSNVCVKI